MASINTDKIKSTKTITLVDLQYPPYRDYFFANKGSTFSQSKFGGEHMLEKTTADRLLKYAKEKQLGYVYNSAYRSKAANVSKGTSHHTAQSIDIQTIIYADDEIKEVNGKKVGSALETVQSGLGDNIIANANKTQMARLAQMACDMHHDSSYGLKNGAVIGYVVGEATPAKIKNIYYDSNGKEIVYEARLKDKSELIHFESSDRDPALEPAAESAIKKLNATDTPSKSVMRSATYVVDQDDKLVSVTPNFVTQAHLAKEYTGNTNRPLPEDYMNTNGLKNVRVYDTQNSDTSTSRIKRDYLSFNPEKPAIPRTLSGDTTMPAKTVVEIDVQQLNNFKDIENLKNNIQNNSNTSKLIKNAFTGKNPYGLEHKHDGPPASIKLVLDQVFAKQRSKSAIAAWEELEKSGIDYIDNFFIERVNKSSNERYQIMQSISEEYKIYFSGKQPEVMNLTGRMLNTYNQQWWHDFNFFYDNYLRGSKAVENRIRAFLTITDTIYEVLLLKFGIGANSAFDNNVQFNIDLVILQETHIGDYKNPIERSTYKTDSSSINISNTQTNYSNEVNAIINNTAATLEDNTGVAAIKGTTVSQNGYVDPNEVANAINPDGSLSKNYFAPNSPISSPSTNTKTSRDKLKNTQAANISKQILLSKYPGNKASLDTLTAKNNQNNKQSLSSLSGEIEDFASEFTDSLNNKYDGASLVKRPETAGEQTASIVSAYNSALAQVNATILTDTLLGNGNIPKDFTKAASKARFIDKIQLTEDVNKYAGKATKMLNALQKAFDDVSND